MQLICFRCKNGMCLLFLIMPRVHCCTNNNLVLYFTPFQVVSFHFVSANKCDTFKMVYVFL